MRIARYLAAAGFGSRRACEALVERGTVQVNGEDVTTPATTVDPDADRVTVNGQPARPLENVYLMLNKPAGYTCSSSDAHAEHLYLELLPDRFGRLFSIGRLDRDSEGLLLVTNDGEFAQLLSHPSHEVTKRYRVRCRGQVDDAALARMCRGIRDAGDVLRAERVRRISSRGDHVELEFVLVEGRKREIRRLCARSGLRVLELRRVAVGPVVLGRLASGRWRHLREPEIRALRNAAGPAGEKP